MDSTLRSEDLAYLQTPAPVARPWGFTDVVAMAYDEQGPMGDGSGWEVPVPGVLWCHYQHGPDLFTLVRIVAQLDPRAKWAGLKSLRPCGFQGKLDRPEPVGVPSGYPFEITLPLWTAPSEERPGVPFLALLSVPEVIEPPAFFRTYRCRLEFWGGCDPGRLAAVYQGQDGLHHVEKNPYTLALLREALGLSRPAATLSLNFKEERYEVTDEAGAIVSFDSSEKIARETAEEAGYEVSWPRP